MVNLLITYLKEHQWTICEHNLRRAAARKRLYNQHKFPHMYIHYTQINSDQWCHIILLDGSLKVSKHLCKPTLNLNAIISIKQIINILELIG